MGKLLRVPKRIIEGFDCLVSGDIKGARYIGEYVGDYDHKKVTNLMKIVKQVLPLFVRVKNKGSSVEIAKYNSSFAPDDSGRSVDASKLVDAIVTAVVKSGTANDNDEATTALSPEELFRKLDVDNSGLLDVEEFRGPLSYYSLSPTEHETIKLFSRFDKDGSGMIDLEEFRTAMQHVSSQ